MRIIDIIKELKPGTHFKLRPINGVSEYKGYSIRPYNPQSNKVIPSGLVIAFYYTSVKVYLLIFSPTGILDDDKFEIEIL